MSSQTVVVVLCALTLGATCYLIASPPRVDDARVAELQSKLDAAEKRSERIEALLREKKELDERIERQLRENDERSVRWQSLKRPEGVTASETPASSDAAKSLEEVVAERVEKRVAEKMDAMAAREHERGDDGKWKAPIDELATELKLTSDQKEQARKIFDHARDEAFTLLKTQRLDGGSLLDDFADALKSGGDPAETTKQFFGRIFSEKVPGTTTSYLAEFLSMHKDVEDALGRQLDVGQMKRLRSLHVDLLDVKTGYDPVGDYVRAKVQ